MNNIGSFLAALKQKGISLTVKDDNLQVNAPKGTVTQDILTELKLNKQQIIDLLKQASDSPGQNRISQTDRSGLLPLSFSQQRMWFLTQLESDKAVYHVPFVLKIEASLDIDRLEYAINKIVERHETLRTVFPSNDGTPFQKVLDKYQAVIERIDLSGTPESEDLNKIKSILSKKAAAPFNLSEGPVFRTTIYKLTDNIHILLLVIHGIAADGWSAGILFDELNKLYEYNNSGSYPLLPLDIQYGDFCVWQRRQFEENKFEYQLQFWKKQLDNLPPLIKFPFETENKITGTGSRGRRIPFIVDADTTKKLHQLVNDNSISPFMLLWGAYALLLHKYTGETDIVLGTPVANRTKTELEKLIGFFANTLVMRVNIDTSASVTEYLSLVREISLNALDNQDMPFDQLIESIDPQRNASHSPIFRTMFVLQNAPRSSGQNSALKISSFDIDLNILHFDISMIVNEFDENISGFIEVNEDVFNGGYAEQILEHYKQILKQIAETPAKTIENISLVTDEEKITILNKWNNNSLHSNSGIFELLEKAALLNTDKDCILFDGETLKYNDFLKRVNFAALNLKKKGIKPGVVVGILLKRSIDLIVNIVAVLKCGAAYLPIDSEYPAERIRVILNESKIQHILCSTELIDKFTFIFLQNLKVLNKDEFVKTGTRAVITELDSIPYPDRGSVDYEKYSRYIGTGPVKNDISILASRGCPYNCMYCHKIWPKKQIIRSSENIFNEVKQYYDCGVRRFTFLDDIFNLKKDVSGRFFEYAIEKLPGCQFFFPNGLRADILTEEFIDLMVKAGTVDVALALESGSPRIQKLIRKNLNLDKFLHNIQYFAEKHPHVFLELQTMFGFPTETEEEANMTLEMIKKVKWIDFPNLHVLKVFPNSDIYRLAIENGVSEEAIRISSNLPYHALPETLPYSKEFARQFQSRFMNEYFLNRERLLHVLPLEFSVFTVSEMVQKYDSYLPYSINSFDDILKYTGIKREELGHIDFVPENKYEVADINEKLRKYFPAAKPAKDALKILLLDVSNLFTSMHETMLHHQIEEPIGQMYLLASLEKNFGNCINGKIAKSLVDFDSFDELKNILTEFQPQVVGFRTLSIYKDFFHHCISFTKSILPNVTVITGGPYASSEYDSMLSDTNIDVAILGEGESTINEFIMKYIENGKGMLSEDNLKKINGVAFLPKANHESIIREGYNRQLIILPPYYTSISEKEAASISADNPVYILFTSGSTGKPKGIVMGTKGASNLINWHLDDPLLSQPMRTLQFASVSFDVSFQEIFTTLASGGTLFPVNEELRKNPFELLVFIEENNIERLFLPVVALQQIAIAAADKNLYPASLKQIITAGEQLKITADIRAFFTKLNNCRLINHYGPTETHVITSYVLDGKPELWPDIPSIGKPVKNSCVYILNNKMQMVPAGVRGELYAAGESLAEGYYLQPELTRERFIENGFNNKRLYKTGDLGFYHPDGNIQYSGRADEQVKIRGYRVEPGDIEAEINKIHGVTNSAVIMAASDSFGNSLMAFVECSDDYINASAGSEKIKTILESRLPDYMIPARIYVVESLPVNSNGKIDKKLLIKGLKPEEISRQHENVTEQEEILLGIWKDLIHIENLGVNDNFFRAGGHSLLATQVVSRVRKLFNVEIQLKDMFEYPTVKLFAHRLNNLLQDNTDESCRPVHSAKNILAPLSYSQEYFYNTDKMYPGKNINNIAGAFKISGDFSKENFINAINLLVKKHEVLRTIIVEKDNKLYQQVGETELYSIKYKDISELDDLERNSYIEKLKTNICSKPFNLSAEGISRFFLAKILPNEYVFLYAVHHTAMDGWSLGILMNELTELYSNKSIQDFSADPSALTYNDFAIYQHKLVENGHLSSQQDYWLKSSVNSVNKSGFPFPKNIPVKTETITGIIPSRQLKEIMNVCRRNDISLFMFMLTAFSEVIKEYKQTPEIAVGTYVSGREYSEFESVVGCFVNLLAFNIPAFDVVSISEKLNTVKNICINGFNNQSFPYCRLSKMDTSSDNAIMNIPEFMFVMRNTAGNDFNLPNVNIVQLPIDHIDSPYPLQCSIYNEGDAIGAAFTYQASCFDAASVQKLLDNFNRKVLSFIREFGL